MNIVLKSAELIMRPRSLRTVFKCDVYFFVFEILMFSCIFIHYVYFQQCYNL